MRPFLLGQREAKFFNYGIGQHFSGNALDLGLCFIAREASVQRELKILSLAHGLETLVTHLLERALNSLALGVENAFLERDVDVSCHKKVIIRDWFGLDRFDLSTGERRTSVSHVEDAGYPRFFSARHLKSLFSSSCNFEIG